MKKYLLVKGSIGEVHSECGLLNRYFVIYIMLYVALSNYDSYYYHIDLSLTWYQIFDSRCAKKVHSCS